MYSKEIRSSTLTLNIGIYIPFGAQNFSRHLNTRRQLASLQASGMTGPESFRFCRHSYFFLNIKAWLPFPFSFTFLVIFRTTLVRERNFHILTENRSFTVISFSRWYLQPICQRAIIGKVLSYCITYAFIVYIFPWFTAFR